MPPAELPSLWRRTSAVGLPMRRALLDETAQVPLAALAGGTTLGAWLPALRGHSVALWSGSQLAVALALLELDGHVRRIVLCTPDLTLSGLRLAVAAAQVDAVITDRPAELAGLGVTVVPSSAPKVTGFGGDRAAHGVTEWVLFTSGTTGTAKLALHSLASLAGAIAGRPATGEVWSTFYDIRRYGGLQILLRALFGGGSMVLSGAQEEVGSFLRRVAAAGVTFLSGTPTHWRRALLSPAAAAMAPAQVRLSGEVADQAILDRLRGAWPRANVCHAYASTEAGVAFEVADGLAGFPAAWVGPRRGGVRLRVVEGTLRIRSPRNASRYLGADAPPLADAEGFVDTSDIVERHGERYLFAGRRDGVINVAGLKVHPEEVEAVVNRHPDVQMSLASGRRSPVVGQVVVVEMVLAPQAAAHAAAVAAEVLAACRRELAPHKVPAAVRPVPALPVNAAGKLIRAHA